MEILSAQQHEAFRSGTLPLAEEITEGIWAVPMGLPPAVSRGIESYSLGYVLADSAGALHIIDPGWDIPENLARWEEFLTSIGRTFDDVGSIVGTHLHPDHLGLAATMGARSGAEIVLHRNEAQALHTTAQRYEAGDLLGASMASRTYTALTKDRLQAFNVPEPRWAELEHEPKQPAFPNPSLEVSDGEVLALPGRTVRVVATPGHTGGHMSLLDEDSGIFFTGDHVLPGINSGIGLGGDSPTNPIADYFASLDKVEKFDPYVIAPGHEYLFRGLSQRVQSLRDHHLRRSREVAAAMAASDDVWQIASQVTWSEGFANLHSYRLASALAQVAMHMEFIESA